MKYNFSARFTVVLFLLIFTSGRTYCSEKVQGQVFIKENVVVCGREYVYTKSTYQTKINKYKCKYSNTSNLSDFSSSAQKQQKQSNTVKKYPFTFMQKDVPLSFFSTDNSFVAVVPTNSQTNRKILHNNKIFHILSNRKVKNIHLIFCDDLSSRNVAFVSVKYCFLWYYMPNSPPN